MKFNNFIIKMVPRGINHCVNLIRIKRICVTYFHVSILQLNIINPRGRQPLCQILLRKLWATVWERSIATFLNDILFGVG